MKSIRSFKNIRGKVALVRVDFNVPIKNGKVEDDFRIIKALPTIKFLLKKSAKVVLITHLGKGGEDLSPIAKSLNKHIKSKFIQDIIGDKAKKAISDMKNGEVILLENLRNDKGEKECSKDFAKNLASLGDLYVNDAFSVCHREDASIVLLPKILPSYVGFQLEEEIKYLSKAKNPKHPFLFILGGAKFSTKMPLIKKYLKLADHIFIGGALLNDFLKAKGYEVGKSLVDNEDYGINKITKNKKIILPDKVIVKSGDKLLEKKVSEVSKEDIILDVSEKSIKDIKDLINHA